MVGVAFEVHDTSFARHQLESLSDDNKDDNMETRRSLALRVKYQHINPSFIDLLAYSFCYIGLLTGPYYKYRTFNDMLGNGRAHTIPTWSPMLTRLKPVPVVAASFLLASHYFSIQLVRSDEFYTDRPLWYRILYMVPMFFVFRTRLYVAWILSECICITSTLGAYPASSQPRCGAGPTNFDALDQRDDGEVEYNFDTVDNLNVYGCELAATVREGMRAWNMTVQYWLATYVYKRLPINAPALRVALTMTVSAFWHGVHAGYYLSFLTIPPCLIAEDLMIRAWRGDSAAASRTAVFDWVCWFFKMRAFEYMSMSFLLLGASATLRYWSSVYFIGHAVILVFILVGYVSRPPRRHHTSPVTVSSTKTD